MDNNTRYLGLDGLRGIAAIAVVTGHLRDVFGSNPLPAAYLAVDLFFCLSGFVLAAAYEQRLPRIGLWSFVKIRLARLYPLYLLGTLLAASFTAVSFALQGGDYSKLAVTTLFSVLFLPTPPALATFDIPYPLMAQAWSLGCEIGVNIVFAAAFLRWGVKASPWLLAAGALILLATALYFGEVGVGARWQDYLGGWGRVTFSFFAGVLVYRLRPKNGPAWRGWGSMGALLALLAIPVEALPAVGQVAIVTLAFPLLVCVASSVRPTGLTARTFSFLGAASYACYVLHIAASMAITAVVRRLGLENIYGPVFELGFFALFLPLCWLLDRYFDGPIRRWLLSPPKSGASFAARPS